MNLIFDQSIVGKKAIANSTDAMIESLYGGYGYSAKAGDYAILTGWRTSTNVCQISSNTNLGVVASLNWNLSDEVIPKTQGQAQDVVNTIIKNNRTIVENNLLCARFSNKLTTSQTQLLAQLQLRLERRNTALIESGCLTSISESYPKGYVNFASNLNSVVGKETIGAVVTTIIIVAIVVASLSTAAYFAYQAYAKESIDDVKFSDDLTKTLLSKLTAEEYEQLRQETGGLITKAKLSAKFSGVFGTVKTFGLIGIGAFLVYKLLTRNKQTSNENE
ncbi:MAG: hypothetical protein RBR97_12180 [Bacteroidales bacterium]|nr:hypothetical protein [Bacteroidales bacterium]